MSWRDTLEEMRRRDWTDASKEDREGHSKQVVEICSFASGTVALVPVPLVDLALLVPVHTAMVMTIGRIYGRALSKTEASRVVAELGAILGLTMAGRATISVLKGLLPGLGSVIAAPAAFAMTWGLGRAAMAYFENPKVSQEHLRKVFRDAVADGRRMFRRDAFDVFRKKNPESDTEPSEASGSEGRDGDPVADVDRPGPSPAPASASQESLRPKKRSL